MSRGRNTKGSEAVIRGVSMSDEVANYTIFGAPATEFYLKKARITLRGHVTIVIEGCIDKIWRVSIGVNTPYGRKVIPISQIKVIELLGDCEPEGENGK